MTTLHHWSNCDRKVVLESSERAKREEIICQYQRVMLSINHTGKHIPIRMISRNLNDKNMFCKKQTQILQNYDQRPTSILNITVYSVEMRQQTRRKKTKMYFLFELMILRAESKRPVIFEMMNGQLRFVEDWRALATSMQRMLSITRHAVLTSARPKIFPYSVLRYHQTQYL